MSISRSQAKKAGKRIRHNCMNDSDLAIVDDSDLAIVQEWRSCCVEITVTCFRVVLDCAQMLDGAVATYRMKRVESIISKLQRPNTSFDLHTLDDIGGCRLIVEKPDQVDEAREWIISKLHEMTDGKVDINVKDYISNPKESGYRSCHLLVRFLDQSLADRVEIQIRTKLQHYWATAVEVFDELYGSSIKSPRGDKVDPRIENCERLLAVVSSLFALEENKPIVPGTAHDEGELLEALLNVSGLELIIKQLDQACEDVTVFNLGETDDAKIFILLFIKDLQLLLVEPYPQEEINEALAAYTQYEQEMNSSGLDSPEESVDKNVVLVRANADEISVAYPNYAANAPFFLERLREYRNEAISGQ